MADKSVAILGGRGMLGTDLVKICRQYDYDVQVFDLPEFDITNYKQLKEAVNSSDTIVNCAAYTNVDGAESQSSLASAVNAEAVGELGTLAQKADKWVLHISTDFVFDGQLNRPYVETDEPNPINEYGRSKLAGEQLLVESGCRNCIMRVEWTYGLAGNNFVKKIVHPAKEKKQLKIVDDQIGSPTSTTEIAKVICQLLRKKPEGLFHYSGSGYVSRFGMAKFIFEKLGVSIDLRSYKSADYKTPAQRPLSSCFCCDKIQTLLSEPIKRWEEPLEEFLRLL